jgi:hypothetical protein
MSLEMPLTPSRRTEPRTRATREERHIRRSVHRANTARLSQQHGEIVVDGGAVAASRAAAEAPVHHHEFTAFVEKPDRLHEPAARRRPVSGLLVDVQRPEAGGAVVGVAVAGDLSATVCTTEVFGGAREAPRQEAPRFVDPDGARRGRSVGGIATRARASGRRSSTSCPKLADRSRSRPRSAASKPRWRRGPASGRSGRRRA